MRLFPKMKIYRKQDGTVPSRRHIQGSKIAKRTSKCQFTVLENRKTKKIGPSGALKKGGTLPKLSTLLSQLKGVSFGEKQIFKKSHVAEKLKGGPYGIFKHPFCCKISKKLKGGPFGEKKN